MAEPVPAPKANDDAPAKTTNIPVETPKPTTTETEEEAPDPSEDDLDELDGTFPPHPSYLRTPNLTPLQTDMLDEFSSTSISASGPGRPAPDPSSKAGATAAIDNPSLASEDFSAQLQKEMAELLGEIDESPEMKRQLDDLMGELTAGAEKALEKDDQEKGLGKKGAGAAAGSGAKEIPKTGESSAATAASEGGDNPAFTDTIRRTMERMAASGEQASAAAQQGGSGGGSEDDMLAKLLQDMATGAGGEGSEEEFSKMLMGMMEQLTNKDILYEPMKDLDGKFPEWIREHDGKIEAGEMQKYKEQQGLVKEIVGRFERKGYSDENPGDREFIVERMQKVG